MSARASTIIRVLLLAAIAIIAAAGLLRPIREPRREASAKAQRSPSEHMTREGLIALDADALLERVRSSQARGIVINVWASWCGSCKQDLPMLLGLKRTLGASIDVLLVSVDESASLPIAAEMLREFGAPSPAFVVDQPLDAFKARINPRWPGMLPATFLFDETGKLRYFWGGPVLEGEILPLLRRYLAGEHVDGEANFALMPGKVTR